QHLVASLHGLVRIAQRPQDLRETDEAKDPLMCLSEEALRVGLLGTVEDDALLQMRAGSVPGAQVVQGIAQRDMRMCKARWIVDPLGQAEHLLSQFPCGLELPAIEIKHHQASQRWEDLWSIPDLLAQLARPVIGGSCVRSRKALGG